MMLGKGFFVKLNYSKCINIYNKVLLVCFKYILYPCPFLYISHQTIYCIWGKRGRSIKYNYINLCTYRVWCMCEHSYVCVWRANFVCIEYRQKVLQTHYKTPSNIWWKLCNQPPAKIVCAPKKLPYFVLIICLTNELLSLCHILFV